MTYNTYLIPQIDDLELCEWLIHLDGGSTVFVAGLLCIVIFILITSGGGNEGALQHKKHWGMSRDHTNGCSINYLWLSMNG